MGAEGGEGVIRGGGVKTGDVNGGYVVPIEVGLALVEKEGIFEEEAVGEHTWQRA